MTLFSRLENKPSMNFLSSTSGSVVGSLGYGEMLSVSMGSIKVNVGGGVWLQCYKNKMDNKGLESPFIQHEIEGVLGSGDVRKL